MIYLRIIYFKIKTKAFNLKIILQNKIITSVVAGIIPVLAGNSVNIANSSTSTPGMATNSLVELVQNANIH